MPTLDWIGKQAVVGHHRRVPYRLLHCDRELSAGDPDSGNLLVQGDNLEALKALLPYYAGQVKCIYIDPPYNTGNEGWAYNDNVNSPEIRRWLGEVVGKEGEDLSRHDKWLCMMYPRLALLREFLAPSGSIFVSIDDNEGQALRLLMNEVFGPRAFVATIVWQKRTSRENRKAVGSAHDYIYIYSPLGAEGWKHVRHKLPPNDKGYSNPDNDPRGPWRSIPFSAQGFRSNQMYTITTPTGRDLMPPKGRCWGAIRNVYDRYLADNRVYFPKEGNGRPRIKQFRGEEEGLVPMTWWDAADTGDNQEAKKEILALDLDGDVFDTPKPTRLIRRILQIATDSDSIVLDSFIGSGTTGHAVLAQNAADGGTRRFIGVELDASICESVTVPRMRKAVGGYGDVKGLGSGYRFCRLGKPLFDETGEIADEVTFADLAAHVFFTETGSPIPRRARKDSPLLGSFQDRTVYLLFNGVLGDKRPDGGNVLTTNVLTDLPEPSPSPSGTRPIRVIYGEGCRLSGARLKREGVVFKQLPYDVKVS